MGGFLDSKSHLTFLASTRHILNSLRFDSKNLSQSLGLKLLALKTNGAMRLEGKISPYHVWNLKLPPGFRLGYLRILKSHSS